MRAYTLSVLTQLAKTGSPMVEKEIVTWVNNKLRSANKPSTLKGFQDQALADGRIVVDLIDAIKPGTINYDIIKEGGDKEVTSFIQHAPSGRELINAGILGRRIIWRTPSTRYRWRGKPEPGCTLYRKTSPKLNRKW